MYTFYQPKQRIRFAGSARSMSFIFGTRVLRLETGSILRVMRTGSLIGLMERNHDVACQKTREKRIINGFTAVPLLTSYVFRHVAYHVLSSTIDTECM